MMLFISEQTISNSMVYSNINRYKSKHICCISGGNINDLCSYHWDGQAGATGIGWRYIQPGTTTKVSNPSQLCILIAISNVYYITLVQKVNKIVIYISLFLLHLVLSLLYYQKIKDCSNSGVRHFSFQKVKNHLQAYQSEFDEPLH